MVIAELIWPGTWLDYSSPEEAWELQSLLHLLDSNIAEANLALMLFIQQRVIDANGPRPSIDLWQRDLDERRAVEQRLEASLPAMTFEEQWKAKDRIRFEAELEVARSRWERGDLPRGLLHHAPFLYARSFVFALDGVAKTLKVIAEQPIPNDSSGALTSLGQAIPDLVGVRNTAQHQEDRIRRLDHRARPIDLQPIDNNLIRSEGGALVLNSLNDDRYGCTLSDGRFGEVEVSDSSLLAARDAVQQLVNSLAWKGPPRLTPMV